MGFVRVNMNTEENHLQTALPTVQDILDWLDSLAPFSSQESWDNSGLLVGERSVQVPKILLTLDITNDVVEEAIQMGVTFILSHHPVIFHPLRQLDLSHPACKMLSHGIQAVCAHTNLDLAKDGVNDVLVAVLKRQIAMRQIPGLALEKMGDLGFGCVCELEKPYDALRLAQTVKTALGCTVVRFTDGERPIRRLAIACGAGGSYLSTALDLADGMLTGDVKHDQWIKAKNHGFTLMDGGHFHTERVILPVLEKKLQNQFPGVAVFISARSKDPVSYVSNHRL